jgi:hypothetical protein
MALRCGTLIGGLPAPADLHGVSLCVQAQQQPQHACNAASFCASGLPQPQHASVCSGSREDGSTEDGGRGWCATACTQQTCLGEVLRLANSDLPMVEGSVSHLAGVKSKIFEILTDTKPMTSAEIWAEAEVCTSQHGLNPALVLHAYAVDPGSSSDLRHGAATFAARLCCLTSFGPPCAHSAAAEEGRAQQAAHEDDATGPTAAGVGGHQARRGGDSQEGQGVPLRAQRENAQ